MLLPGFKTQQLGTVPGYITSIVTDSQGTIYCTTTNGSIVRFTNGGATVVARVTTQGVGTSGLLGMALRNDTTAIVHYTTEQQIFDVIASVDLTTGAETIIHRFQGDALNGGPVSNEHHGGNPIVAPDGSIFVAIGDGYNSLVASRPDWNLGKIFRIFPDGRVVQFARGVRNPFDLSWDAANKRLIVPDNGDLNDDEINIVHEGDDLGWPFTMGSRQAVSGTVAPVFSFPTVVAPTGIAALTGTNPMLRRGFVLAGFVPRALFYIDDVDAQPMPAPLPIISGVTDPIVDVTVSSAGDVFFAAGRAIYRLNVPQRGDCNGDGLVDGADLPALLAELGDASSEPAIAAQDGANRGSWGCDANSDGLISVRDVPALKSLLGMRMRAVR